MKLNVPKISKGHKKALLITGAVVSVLIISFIIFINRIVEPILKQKLHSLIIDGSDKLYTYSLGDLDAHFLSGSVEVENLQIQVDSTRYKQLAKDQLLPSLTMQVNLVKGHIKGIRVLPLLLNKKIKLREVMSHDADVVLIRHINKRKSVEKVPLWKSLQPAINGISVDKVNLDGVKLLYKHADTSESMKIQFDHCVALMENLRIDSAAASDTNRIVYAKILSLQFNDLKYRTADSSHKMKAEVITYSSSSKLLELKGYKVQPTLKGDAFFKKIGHRESWHIITVDLLRVTNFNFTKLLHENMFSADTAFVVSPDINIYMDKTYLPSMKNKIGNYPHQNLLGAKFGINIRGIKMEDLDLLYTERSDVTLQEGAFTLKDVDILISNVTNDSALIEQNPKSIAVMDGFILSKSPMHLTYTFHLDSSNGAFETSGLVKNVAASQLNGLAVPLANVRLESFNIHELKFNIRGDDLRTTGNISMLYDNLALTFLKIDPETGTTSKKGFLTKIVNKYTIKQGNPSGGTVARTANGVQRARISNQSFFGFIWKTIFYGMQNIIMDVGS